MLMHVVVKRKKGGAKVDKAMIARGVLIAIMTRGVGPKKIQDHFGVTPFPQGPKTKQLTDEWLRANAPLLPTLEQEVVVDIQDKKEANRIVVRQMDRVANVSMFDELSFSGQADLRRAIIDAVNAGFNSSQRDDSFEFTHAWSSQPPRRVIPAASHPPVSTRFSSAHGR